MKTSHASSCDNHILCLTLSLSPLDAILLCVILTKNYAESHMIKKVDWSQPFLLVGLGRGIGLNQLFFLFLHHGI